MEHSQILQGGARPFWRRYRFVLFAVALLLPVLSALGFVEMGRELARQRHIGSEGAAVTEPEASNGTNISPEVGAIIAPWRTGLLLGRFRVLMRWRSNLSKMQ